MDHVEAELTAGPDPVATGHRNVGGPVTPVAAGELSLTATGPAGQILDMPPIQLQRLDPERRRRRLQLLAALSGTQALRDRVSPRRTRVDRLRDLIASRRRLLA